MACMSLDCVGLTQASVIHIIYHNVGQKCFFIYLIFTRAARLSHCNSVCLSVRLSDCHTHGSVKNGAN